MLTFCYKDISRAELNELMKAQSDLESLSLREKIEADMTYLCTFGMRDDLRDEVTEAISLLKYGSNTTIVDNNGEVNVRILTGDHIETAKQVALHSGIIM